MAFLLLLIPANYLISAYLSKHGLRLAAIFHLILFAVTFLTGFIVSGGAARDFVGQFLHLSHFFDLLIEMLGAHAGEFIAPFCLLETGCYIIVAIVFVKLTAQAVDAIVRFFKSRVLSTIVYDSSAFRASDFPTRVEKLFRKNCIMRC